MTGDQTSRPGGDEDLADAAAEISDQENENLVQSIVEKITPDSRYTKLEFVATIILAVAAVLTAWTALQSAKWSGDQATNFSQAGANRTESVRFDNRATSMILLDEQTFMQWGQAIQSEIQVSRTDGIVRTDPTVYDPSSPSASG